MNAMTVGEPGLASKPASPAAGPTQVRLRCKDTQWQVAVRSFPVAAKAPMDPFWFMHFRDAHAL